MKNIEIVEVRMIARKGANIRECIKEAITLASTEWKNVRLVHNEKEYSIKPNDMLALIIEQSWNFKRKGEFN